MSKKGETLIKKFFSILLIKKNFQRISYYQFLAPMK